MAMKIQGAGGAVEDGASNNGTGVSQGGRDDVKDADGGVERSSKPVKGNPGSAPIDEQPAEGGTGSKPGARGFEDKRGEANGKKDPRVFEEQKPQKGRSFWSSLNCCTRIDEE